MMEETITRDFTENEKAVPDEFNAHAIVICTGLNGGTLCDNNECYPLRGALIRLFNDGLSFPTVA